MQVVYTVPYRLNPILAFMLRWLTRIIMAGSVIFTSIGCVKALRNVQKSPVQTHGTRTVPKPVVTPWPY